MHPTAASKVIFTHHGDYSGPVIITDRRTKKQLIVPFEDLKSFVADYVRSERTRALGLAEDDVVLGLVPLTNPPIEPS